MKEISDQVRGVIFVVVAMLFFVVWSYFFKPPVTPPQQKPGPAAQTSPTQTPAPPQTAAAPATAAAAPAPTVAQASEEKTFVLESPLYRVELSNRGGVVRSWKLKKYFDDQKPPHALELVNVDAAQQLGWPFSLILSDGQLETQANAALFKSEIAQARAGARADAPLVAAIPAEGAHIEAPAVVNFHWSDGHLDVTKQLKFNKDYELAVEVNVTLDGKPMPAAIAWRGGFGDQAVYKASTLVNVFYKLNGKLATLQSKNLGVPKNQGQSVVQAGPLEFTGIEDQFFCAAFLPDGTDLSLWHWTQDHNVTVDDKPASEPIAEMAAGSPLAVPVKMRVFVGPKDLDLLAREKPPLEELVQFGWFGIIAKPLLLILQWIQRYVPNWGWAIVVLTLIINMLMFPLKMKSWRSMQKMQKVMPEIRSIQDRYKKYSMSDPRKRKMNEEVTAIYQREGINPMGSCLPMLFQMPIWLALWRVLNGAIELRHASWIGWIKDLSAMDPYYILPIGMTITMYLTTKMTPQTSADPAQQKMMALMPLMMGFFFFRLSSGLNLYMFTSNIVAVGQQLYLNRAEPLPAKGKFKKKKE
ncbi:MAG: membrane protein insertase YidC [Candidatus Acidiferrales bacterium]